MGKGLPRSVGSRALNRASPIQRTDIPLSGLAVSVAGAAGVGFGTSVVGGLPEGNLLILGAVLSALATEASANIVDTFNPTTAIGSAPTADATLNGAEVDIVPATAAGAAVSSVATVRNVSTPTESGTILDNTAGTLELNLNVTIPDLDISGTDDVTFDGVLSLVYVILGDD